MKIRKLFQVLILLHVALFMTSVSFADTGYQVDLGENTSHYIELNFNVVDYDVDSTVKDGQNFSVIEFQGGVRTNQKGYAELPFLNSTIALADNADATVEVIDSSFTDIDLSYPLLPSKGVILRNENPSKIPHAVDPRSIVDEWYPKELIKDTDPFIFRDIRGIGVFAYPFRYNAKQKVLRVYDQIRVRVNYNLSKTTNPLFSGARTISSEMNDIYQTLFLNYADSKSRFIRSAADVLERGDILVIHTARDKQAIAPYVAWKTEKGFKVTTKEVAKGTNVKSLIKNEYASNKNLLYVQLVGDWDDLKSDIGTSQNAPMDPMLGCVVGNDNYPDLIIGRFSANSADHVSIQVEKTIAYEKNPDLNGNWYSAGLGIGSGEGSGTGDDGEADFEHMDIIKKNKLLTFTYTDVKDVYKNGTPATVKNYLEQGLSIINYTGHGSETSFVTSGFSNSNISGLTNGSKLPFIFSVACVNGKFHMSGDCFAESWLKKKNGGAVATLMATINQPWQPPMRGQDYMNDLLIGGYDYSKNPGNGTNVSTGRTTFGSIAFNGTILMYAESSKSDDLDTLQTWTIFGDASLQVRTAKPKTISLSNQTVSSGQPFSTTVTSGGKGAEGAMVALSQNGTVFSAVTDASGNSTLSHSFTGGSAKLVVTGFNLETKSLDVNIGGGGSNQKPEARFSFTPTNLTVKFKDESVDPDGQVTGYAWDFGDKGGVSKDKNPSYTYSKAGTYQVALVVTDDKGATGRVTKNVTVGSSPNPTSGASDSFEGYGWKGGEGWLGPWKKSGDVKKLSTSPYEGKKYVRFRSNTGYLERSLDITGATSITLKFAGRVRSFEQGDKAIVKAGTDPASMKEVLVFTSSDSDNKFKVHEVNLSEFAGKGNAKLFIAFDSEMDKIKDYWYIDIVEVLLGK